MPDDQPAGSLWRDVDPAGLAPPSYRDAPDRAACRHYGTSDGLVLVDGDVLRLAVRSSKRAVAVFGWLFVPAFVVSAALFIPDPGSKVTVVVMGTFAGMLTFGSIYALMSHHEKLGDYLVVDRHARMIRLPRSRAEFPFDRVVGFQWIRGRARRSPDVEVDLNLLVTADGGDVVRHHVMGSPARRSVERVIEFSGIPLDAVDLPRRAYRDADRNRPGK